MAIDAGTTGVKALAIDESGRPVASAYQEVNQIFPRPGWVEHDPGEIWQRCLTTLSSVADHLGAEGRAIAAIGITNQRETTVVWDRSSGLPLHNAIVWQDRRTAARCEELLEMGHFDLVRSITGLVPDPYFSATKLEWLLGEGGVEVSAGLAFGTVDSWVAWNLTGGAHVTDPSNASRTMLFDIRSRCWSEDLCSLFSIPIELLPTVTPTSARVGETVSGLGSVPAGIPVAAMVGDQAAALFGQACFEPGMTKNTYGTGSFVLMNVGSECPDPADGLLTSVAWDLGNSPGGNPALEVAGGGVPPQGGERGSLAYALEGSIFSTGATVQWLRDGLEIIDSAADVNALARSAGSNGGAYLVPAFSGLGSPWWDPWARGAIVGLSPGVGRAQLARAALESMAFQTRDVVEAMTRATGRPVRNLRVDGGASASDFMLQFQADQLNVVVARPTVPETTALGAAYLAGLAVGMWSNQSEISTLWHQDAAFHPDDGAGAADKLHQGWLRAIQAAKGWARSSGP